MGRRAIRIALMILLNCFGGVSDMLHRLPCPLLRPVSYPLHMVLQLPLHHLRIHNQGWQSAGKTRSPDPRPTRYYASRSGSVMRSCFNSRVRSEVEADPIKVGSGSIKGYKPPGKCRSGHEMWSGFPGF